MERSDTSLAATKLRPPIPPTRLVRRSRLDQVVDTAVAVGDVALVLVSAPAGSGKSTLLAGWVAASPTETAWLQLEDSDADPARFWVSVVAALGRVDPDAAARIEPVVRGAMGSAEVVVAAIVNELCNRSNPLVLVLDDYHLVDDPEVHRGMVQLLELCPAQLTIVLVTRADPPFRLGRMRVRGRVKEIRATDLRFDSGEAQHLLGDVAERLDDKRLGELCERTEGWAAGLVLAGLSLEHSTDAERFVDTFRGDDQLVVGYLTDELLASLQQDERRRIVEAAVLHRLNGPLLDAVTGSTDGARWLEALATRNQLVIRLDRVGEWYRYHHLFRDMLLLEARRAFPERLAELHRAAAAWFEASSYPAAAVDHLIAAGERDRAMYLMRFVGPDLLGSGQLRTLRNVLGRLAEDGELDPICMLLAGWDHYLTGRYDTAQQLLDRATATLTDDIDVMRTMPLRINLALGRADVTAALTAARDVIDAGELAERPSELITAVGAALTWAGLVDDARPVLATALQRTQEEHRVTAHAMVLVARAVGAFHAGRDALTAAQQALQFATSSGLGEYHGIAPAVVIAATLGPDRTGREQVATVVHAASQARTAATTLGLTFTLLVAADLLSDAGDERGRELLDEAGRLVRASPDAGINATMFERLAGKHRHATTAPPSSPALVDQLSERELAVLRYLPSTLSLPEIARELYVSPNTVKTQCSAIYRKLGVTSRAAAVETARRLHLI